MLATSTAVIAVKGFLLLPEFWLYGLGHFLAIKTDGKIVAAECSGNHLAVAVYWP